MKKRLVGYDYNGPRGYKIIDLVAASEADLPFHFITFGRSYEEININWNGTDKCFVIYSEKGSGRAFIKGKWADMPAGSVAYWPFGHSVKYEPVGDEPWQISFFTYAGRNAESMLGTSEFALHSEELSFMPEFTDFVTEKHDKDDWRELSVSGLAYMLMKIRRAAEGFLEHDRGVAVSKKIQQSVKYINENFTEELSVATLAENCSISEEYYCRMFKKFTGTTPTGYINSLRISRACDLLHKEKPKKIEEIGFECGFNSVTYFNKIFKREMGISPTQFREKQRQ